MYMRMSDLDSIVKNTLNLNRKMNVNNSLIGEVARVFLMSETSLCCPLTSEYCILHIQQSRYVVMSHALRGEAPPPRTSLPHFGVTNQFSHLEKPC